MSLSAAVPVMIAADVALIALVAFVMSRASLLTPHREATVASETALAPAARERSKRRATRRGVPAERMAATPQPVRS